MLQDDLLRSIMPTLLREKKLLRPEYSPPPLVNFRIFIYLITQCILQITCQPKKALGMAILSNT